MIFSEYVGSCHIGCVDITSVALEWAKWNAESNPQVSALIEIRSAIVNSDTSVDDEHLNNSSYDVTGPALPPPKQELVVVTGPALPTPKQEPKDSDPLPKEFVINSPIIGPEGPPKAEIDQSVEFRPDEEPSEVAVPCSESGDIAGVLVGVVREEERFDFCMCNPPFFASMDEAGLNPRTACGGTAAEMVCPGGEEAFVARIIEDSAQLKHVIQCVSYCSWLSN